MLVSNYQLQMQRLDLFRQECKQYAESQQTTGVCALRIMEQPLPQILFKGKQIEEQYMLCLLTGTTQNFDGVRTFLLLWALICCCSLMLLLLNKAWYFG